MTVLIQCRVRRLVVLGLAGLFALAFSNARAVAGAGPPDVGAAMEGLFYLVVGSMVVGAILVIWIVSRLVSRWRKRQIKDHNETSQ